MKVVLTFLVRLSRQVVLYNLAITADTHIYDGDICDEAFATKLVSQVAPHPDQLNMYPIFRTTPEAYQSIR
jgi:hypothetical protein